MLYVAVSETSSRCELAILGLQGSASLIEPVSGHLRLFEAEAEAVKLNEQLEQLE